MLERMVRWMRGYVYFCLKGYGQERFLNLCQRRGLQVWGISKVKNECCGYMMLEDYWQVRVLARKAHVLPLVVGRIGFPFYQQKLYRKKGCLFGFMSGIAVVYGLSLFVWNISFVGQHSYTEEYLLKVLEQKKIQTGMLCSKVNGKDIEDYLRQTITDIGWVSVELKGTCLQISIVETKMPQVQAQRIGGYHLVAKEAGTVSGIITRQGTPLVKKGSKVKAGDILISGILCYKDDTGEIVQKESVCADGDITMQIEEEYTNACSMIKTRKKFTKYEKKVIQANVFGKKIYLSNPFKGFNKHKKYDIIANVCDLCINKSFYLPISYGDIVYKEYDTVEETRTETEAKALLEEQYMRYEKEQAEQGISILHKKIDFVKQKNNYVLKGKLLVEKNVKEYQKVTKQEWRLEQTDEFDGDND